MDDFTYKRNNDFQSGTSYPEQFLYRSLLQIFDVENRKKEPDIGLEFDITISELNLRIEYSGDYWHIGKEKNDELRRVYCKSRAINYIEIIESQGIQKSKVYNNNLYTRIHIKSDLTFEKKNELLTSVLKYILGKYGHNISEIDIERSIYEALIVCKKYKYLIIKKDGKIMGTENRLYATNLNCDDYIEDSLDGTEGISDNLVEEIMPACNIKEDKSELVSNIEELKEETVEQRQKVFEEIEDCTLVNYARTSNMTTKQFNQHCKQVMKNWNNW